MTAFGYHQQLAAWQTWVASGTSARARHHRRGWLEVRGGTLDDQAFPGRVVGMAQFSTRHYARLVDERIAGTGLRSEDHRIHPLRRTKASSISKRASNRRAAQILRGHTKNRSTVRYLGADQT